MSKRKATEPPPAPVQVTVNTMNNYFSKKAGPAEPPPAPTGPANLFPGDERRHWIYKPYHGKTRPVLVSQAALDGTLKAGCFNCTKSFLPIERFAPPECNYNGRNLPFFHKALSEYDAAWALPDLEAAREARARVEEYRIDRCPLCAQNAGKLSPVEQACKDEWVRMRKEACAKQDGCRYSECVERGEQAWCVLEGDHVHTKAEADEDLRKTERLSQYKWWSWNGGVTAMRAEAAKGLNWPCRFCHRLEPTSTGANKYKDPATMPDGKSSGTEDEIAQYKRKWSATVKYPKQQFVDAYKRDVLKCCELCKRPVLPGQEHAFIFDHLDPTTKLIGKDTLAGESGGVAGLVANATKATTLDKIQSVLEAEMAKCRLLCANCDHRQTNGYPPCE